jgi:ferredoxin
MSIVMAQITIDGRSCDVPAGTTILQAAKQLGISIPTMCHREGLPAWTSCMVCVVQLAPSGRLVPSCAMLVEDGMVVQSDVDEVRSARRAAIELLLSDHVGDCSAPCELACPAHMNIPLVTRHIAHGRSADAIRVAKERIALPAILGRICPAPCEKACRRRQHDAAVSICLLKRFAADVDLASVKRLAPVRAAATGKRVAVVGSGPAGLAAAYYLALRGHACTIYEREATAGGALRSFIGEDRLPRSVLDAEVQGVLELGVGLTTGTEVGSNPTIAELRRAHNAVLVAAGPVDEPRALALGLAVVDMRTFATTVEGVFAAGACVRPTKVAVRSLADGRSAAEAIDRYLRGEPVVPAAAEWNCRMGKLLDGEMERFVATADARDRIEPANGLTGSFSADEARAEARRCLHCDCRSADTCVLRRHAAAYGAEPRHYAGLGPAAEAPRRAFEQNTGHDLVIYEPGKCIACGICVRICERSGERLGLTFIGRGFDVRVLVPFDEPLQKALRTVAAECAEACPTGALALNVE